MVAPAPADGALHAISSTQLVELWAPEPGWQVVRYHPAGPELLAVGLFGEPYVPPDAQPMTPAAAGQHGARRLPTERMPRLLLQCENGVTALMILRPTQVPTRTRRRSPPRSFAGSTSFSGESDGKIVLVLGEDERIEIDLRDYLHRLEPVYLPEPYDTIGRLRRHETAYYFEIGSGDAVRMDFGSGAWGASVDAMFPLEGLDDLLRTTRDPCHWRAS